MKHRRLQRLTALLLTAILFLTAVVPVGAAETENIPFVQTDNSTVTATPHQDTGDMQEQAPEYADNDIVRVSVFLNEDATLDVYSQEALEDNPEAQAYRDSLRRTQDQVVARIRGDLDMTLDVVWQLTLAANAISANIRYGDIADIEAIPGVKAVVPETLHEPQSVQPDQEPPADPLMASSTHMVGANVAWQSGYTGAGMRIAIIDTGLDTDHQSVDPAALEHALRGNAQAKGMDYEDYLESIQVETSAEIAEKLPQLNMSSRSPQYTAEDVYLNLKTPFAYNYIDKDLDVTHDVDHDSDHGSHVAGISAANRYIYKDAQFVNAGNTVGVVGNAPDAQLFVMKVFGKHGGAYDSDYMAAIEDAIVLGCDTVNLSLGSTAPGMSTNPWYQEILDSLARSNTVVSISAGNASRWSNYVTHGKLYVDGGLSFHTVSSPGSYTNALTVASVNNDPTLGRGFEVAGQVVAYAESLYSNAMFASLDTSADQSGTVYPYIYLTGYGKPEDYEGIDVAGRIVLVSRGAMGFYEKANTAAEHGAIALVVCNNEPGLFNMNLDGYKYTAPAVTISQDSAQAIRRASREETAENGAVFYTGTLDVNHKSAGSVNGDAFYRMSGFSSWGVPSSLELKPEISAPGGNIYSLSGSGRATDQYQYMSGTSMAAPQIAGVGALVKEAIEDRGISQPGLTDRALVQSLMMSTAIPMKNEDGRYIPVLRQGAGLANASAAVSADSYLLLDGQEDGKVKAEVLDDPQRTGCYSFTFHIHNLSNSERTYQLTADLFTQDTDGTYLDIKTAPLDAELTWSAEGTAQGQTEGLENYDFNADGKVDRRDAQALLDYVNAERSEIASADHADLSGDGRVDSYDVHVLLGMLDGEDLTVPAGGDVAVTVDLRLSEEQKQILNSRYPTGAYVEGFVYLQPLSDAEGAVGTAHSIPVLGYYGSWTDANMFDNGSYQTHKGGVETRDAYMGNTFINTFSITYQDLPYTSVFFGGNPVLNDNGYFPERNAINAQRGDRISSVTTSPIRNAGAYQVTLENETTGQILYQNGAVKLLRGAYYHGGLGGWNGSTRKTAIDWTAEGLEEGDVLSCRYSLAPELYVGPGKTVRWEDLGPGAVVEISATVDNTAPVVENVSLNKQTQMLEVTVRDNRYVAGVMLYNTAGDTLLGSAVSAADAQPGESAVFRIDVSKVNGSKFRLQAADYARNLQTCQLEIPMGNGRVQLPMFVAYHPQLKSWCRFDTDTSLGYMIDSYAPASLVFRAGTMAGSQILSATDDGMLYTFQEDDFTAPVKLSELDFIPEDMAYNPADGMVYAISGGQLLTLDAVTGEAVSLGAIGVPAATLACDREGLFYCSAESAVYTFTRSTLAEPQLLMEVKLPAPADGIQSMEMDLDTGLLYWVSHYTYKNMAGEYSEHAPFLEIDPAGKTANELGDLWVELPALLIQSDYAAQPHTPAEAAAAKVLPEAADGSAMGLQALTDPMDLPLSAQPETDCGSGTVSLTLRSDAPTTNGRIRVGFDPGLVRYVSSTGAAQVSSVHVEEGYVDLAYAYKNERPAETALGQLRFTVLQGSEAVFTLTVLEENTRQPNRNETVTVPTPVHDYRDKSILPTCTAAGYTEHTCRRCGYSFRDQFVNALGHDWGDWTVKTPATNQKEGIEVRTCNRCGQLEMRPIPKTDHSYEARVIAPTCTEPGYTLHTCTVCGDSYRDHEVPALGHDWGQWTVQTPATSTAEGVEIRTCTRCNQTETRPIPRLPHEDHTYVSQVVPATCTSQGYTLHTCTVCGYSYKDTLTPALGHDWGQWSVQTPATCTAEGTEIRTCARCGETGTRPIPRAAHSYEARVTAPTCTREGFTTYTCTVCGHSYQGNSTPALGHDWGQWTTEKEATCQHTGLEKRVCTRCGQTERRTTPKTDHHYVPQVTPPTCTAEGYTDYTCSMCGRHYRADAVPALGHDWSGWTVTKAPTCERQGQEQRSCTRCGVTETRHVPRAGHHYTAQTTPPTCTREGFTILTCTVCGQKYRTDTVPAAGHSWGAWTVQKAATCTREGLEIRTCQVCGDSEFRTVPQTQHHYVDTLIPPTCTTEGHTHRLCTVCGRECLTDHVPALGHDWDAWVTEEAASCSHPGRQSHTCSRCGVRESSFLPKTPHEYGPAQIIAATCTSGGYTIRVCRICGQRQIRRTQDALGHDWGPWFEQDGQQVHTCRQCGVIQAEGILRNTARDFHRSRFMEQA